MNEVGEGRDAGSSGGATVRDMRARLADRAVSPVSNVSKTVSQPAALPSVQIELPTPNPAPPLNRPPVITPLPEVSKDPVSQTQSLADAVGVPTSSGPARVKTASKLRKTIKGYKNIRKGDDFSAGPKLPLAAYFSSAFINILVLALPLVILQVYDRVL